MITPACYLQRVNHVPQTASRSDYFSTLLAWKIRPPDGPERWVPAAGSAQRIGRRAPISRIDVTEQAPARVNGAPRITLGRCLRGGAMFSEPGSVQAFQTAGPFVHFYNLHNRTALSPIGVHKREFFIRAGGSHLAGSSGSIHIFNRRINKVYHFGIDQFQFRIAGDLPCQSIVPIAHA